MQTKVTLLTLALATVLTASGAAAADDTKQSSKGPAGKAGMEQMGKDHGMMPGGMMHGGMMGMMNDRCMQMMSGSMAPRLPAGNEKLQLQMQAEMMQKMGEILAKYADKISVEAGRTP